MLCKPCQSLVANTSAGRLPCANSGKSPKEAGHVVSARGQEADKGGGQPSLFELVDESEDAAVVEDILKDLVADSEAYMSGFQVRKTLGRRQRGSCSEDLTAAPAVLVPQDIESVPSEEGRRHAREGGESEEPRPPPGGARVKPEARKELFDLSKGLMEQLLAVHGLSCTGMSAEWVRGLDGRLHLMAVHHLEWDGAIPARHLHGIVSSITVNLPLGVKTAGSAPNGSKPGWNTNTKKLKTFQAGSRDRPDRVEGPPSSVHLPEEASARVWGRGGQCVGGRRRDNGGGALLTWELLRLAGKQQSPEWQQAEDQSHKSKGGISTKGSPPLHKIAFRRRIAGR